MAESPADLKQRELHESTDDPRRDETFSLSSDNEDESLTEMNGPLSYLSSQLELGIKPDDVLRSLLGPSVQIPADTDEISLWEAVLELMFRPPARDPLPNISTLDDVVTLIHQSTNIIVLSGAGISVSCGIPDFRSPDGLYARLAMEFPDLIEPQSMFDINFFELDPRPFFKFAKEIFPGKYTPSPCHQFIAALEKKGKLLRNYTQNIDTLEKSAGITRVLYCHGSFSTATCRKCKLQAPIEELKETILKEEVPYCVECIKVKNEVEKKHKANKSDLVDDDEEIPVGVMKPDIVFFGEGLPEAFHNQLQEDKTKADLLIVMGSSLKVRPVSLIPDVLPDSVPRILINRERLQYIKGFDVRLLGYGDNIVNELCKRLGSDWTNEHSGPSNVFSPEQRIYLFDGAIWPPCSEKSEAENEEQEAENEEQEAENKEQEAQNKVEKASLDLSRQSDNEEVSVSMESSEEHVSGMNKGELLPNVTNSHKRNLENSELEISSCPQKQLKHEISES